MKARIPKAYRDLTPKAKAQLQDYVVEIATEAAKKQEEHDCRVILDIYMKQVCCILHDAFGFGEERLTLFIGNHKRLFARQSRLVDKGEQTEYLNSRMSEIFKKNGFPQDFIDNILGEVVIVDAPQEEG